MKKLLFLLGFCFASIFSFGQDAISEHFESYQESDDFTNIYISQKMFGMISNVNIEEPEGKEIMEMVKDLTGLRILTTDQAEKDFYPNAVKKLKSNDFVELMTVKENDQDIIFLIDEGEGDKINELVLMTSELNSVVIMSFKGNLDLNKIAKMSKKLDINGVEHLEKLQERN